MPRKVSRCLLSVCILLSIAIFVSFLDRFMNGLGHRNYITRRDKSTNNAGMGEMNARENSHEISARGLYVVQSRTGSTVQKGNRTLYDYEGTINDNYDIYGGWTKTSVEKSFEIFKQDWCRIQRARLEWKDVLGPCLNSTVWEEPIKARLGINQITDPSKSYISHWDIRNAGEFSRFVIQTVSTSNLLKTIGGDTWRISIQGPSSLAPTVLDFYNGTYEVLFLIIEDGDYEAKIFLDYSLCNGFKDPPPNWFRKGNSQGKNQRDGALKGDRPYLIAPFRDGEKVTFHVPASENNLRNKRIDFVLKHSVRALMKEVASKSTSLQYYTCNSSCTTLLWDGFGRWVKGQWKPYIEESVQKEKRNKEGVFFTFGDSISNAFYASLINGPYKGLCNTTFNACRRVYHWVYDMTGYWGDGITLPREPLPDGVDYDHDRVISDVKKTLFNPEMTEKSVLLLNMGIHFAATVNFTNYRRLIDEVIRLVNEGKTDYYRPFNNATNTFKGRFIWKTSTALHRERFPNPHKDVRRFLTISRVKLFNAYTTYAMCSAGIDVIDVHPISESYSVGTVSNSDPVHYADHVFRGVEALLYRMFSPLDD